MEENKTRRRIEVKNRDDFYLKEGGWEKNKESMGPTDLYNCLL